ncbi:MAG: methyltransferase domain-containing protein [Saprospiraceae bacterium]
MSYKKLLDNEIEEKIHEEIVNIIKPYCKGTNKVLDLGCGDDWIANKIDYKTLHLVDRELEPINTTGILRGNIISYKMDIKQFLSFAEEMDAKYDIIFLLGVIEHLNHKEKGNLLGSVKGLLNDGGIFVMGYPNARSLNRVLGVEMDLINTPYVLTDGDKQIGHQSMYDSRAINHFRFYLQLKTERIEGIMFKPLPNFLMLKYFRNDLDKFVEIGKEVGWEYCGYILAIYRKENES